MYFRVPVASTIVSMAQQQHADVRRQAFARILNRAIAVLEQEIHKEPPPDFPEGSLLATLRIRSDSSLTNAVLAAERLSASRRPVTRVYNVNPYKNLQTEAAWFFEQWKLANTSAIPSPRFHIRCLADAMEAVRSYPDYPRDEFVVRVSENFESWKQEFQS